MSEILKELANHMDLEFWQLRQLEEGSRESRVAYWAQGIESGCYVLLEAQPTQQEYELLSKIVQAIDLGEVVDCKFDLEDMEDGSRIMVFGEVLWLQAILSDIEWEEKYCIRQYQGDEYLLLPSLCQLMHSVEFKKRCWKLLRRIFSVS